MTASPSYQFSFQGGHYAGLIPSKPGRIDTGNSDLYGRVLNNGTVVFRPTMDRQEAGGDVNVASNVSLSNFYTLTVNDILDNSTIDVATRDVTDLYLAGAATDSVFVSANESNSSTFTGLKVGGYGIIDDTHSLEFLNVATVLLHGIGPNGALGEANVYLDTQPKLTVVENLLEANLTSFGSMSSPYLLEASDVGLLNFNGNSDPAGMKIFADNLGTVNVIREQIVDYAERRPSSNLNLNVTNAMYGVFSLRGGNETVNLLQGANSYVSAG